MKITKRQLKRIIREEYSELRKRGLVNETMTMPALEIDSLATVQPAQQAMLPPAVVDSGSLSNDKIMELAKACCTMEPCDLFTMCAELCTINPGMSAACCELCHCVSNHDLFGCCSCLTEICSCPECTACVKGCCGC